MPLRTNTQKTSSSINSVDWAMNMPEIAYYILTFIENPFLLALVNKAFYNATYSQPNKTLLLSQFAHHKKFRAGQKSSHITKDIINSKELHSSFSLNCLFSLIAEHKDLRDLFINNPSILSTIDPTAYFPLAKKDSSITQKLILNEDLKKAHTIYAFLPLIYDLDLLIKHKSPFDVLKQTFFWAAKYIQKNYNENPDLKTFLETLLPLFTIPLEDFLNSNDEQLNNWCSTLTLHYANNDQICDLVIKLTENTQLIGTISQIIHKALAINSLFPGTLNQSLTLIPPMTVFEKLQNPMDIHLDIQECLSYISEQDSDPAGIFADVKNNMNLILNKLLKDQGKDFDAEHIDKLSNNVFNNPTVFESIDLQEAETLSSLFPNLYLKKLENIFPKQQSPSTRAERFKEAQEKQNKKDLKNIPELPKYIPSSHQPLGLAYFYKKRIKGLDDKGILGTLKTIQNTINEKSDLDCEKTSTQSYTITKKLKISSS